MLEVHSPAAPFWFIKVLILFENIFGKEVSIMSNILLALLFALLCFTQWQLSRQGTSLLCYLPTGLYLLIVGIASVRTILDDTFSLQAAVLLLRISSPVSSSTAATLYSFP